MSDVCCSDNTPSANGREAPIPHTIASRILFLADRSLPARTNLPCNCRRNEVVMDLLDALELLRHPLVQEEEVPRAALDELIAYHDADYIHFLESREDDVAEPPAKRGRTDAAGSDATARELTPIPEDEEYGAVGDCHPFHGMWENALLTAGASLRAAAALKSGKFKYAFNLCGGRHHAKAGSASGFCFVNDVVLSVLRLRADANAAAPTVQRQ